MKQMRLSLNHAILSLCRGQTVNHVNHDHCDKFQYLRPTALGFSTKIVDVDLVSRLLCARAAICCCNYYADITVGNLNIENEHYQA
jgi:hypothetical protein